jgi:ABC-type uncharacterized transport system permease subunit
MDKVTVFCFLASYTVATGMEVVRLRSRNSVNRYLTLAMGAAGFLAHTFYLSVRAGQTDLPPLLASAHDWLLVLAWSAVLMYLFLSALDKELPLGVFVLPVVLALVTASRFVSMETSALLGDTGKQAAINGWVMLHTAFLVFGGIGVIGGLVLALMYLVQHRRLKHKTASQPGLKLPSLAKLARLNWWSVVVSVPMLTLGIAAGVLLALNSKNVEVQFEFTDPFIIGSGIAWLVMVSFFFWLLCTKRPVEKQVAMLTVWACSFLLLSIVGLVLLTGSGVASMHS